MGGSNESVVKQTSQPVVVGGPGPEIVPSAPTEQAVRIHENNGEIHFHLDKSNNPNIAEDLKVAVPAADWYSAWRKISTDPSSKFQYVDKQRGTMVTVQQSMNQSTVDAEINVEKIQVGQTFAALEKVTHGK